MSMRISLWMSAVLTAFGVSIQIANAADLSAELDRESVAEDESVSLQLTIHGDRDAQADTPEFNAPDFETINEFVSSSVQSSYINGSFKTVVQKQFTFVLRPKKQGKLKISGIHANTGSTVLRAPDQEVIVSGGGAATQPPQNYGGAGSGLRGAGKASRGSSVFMRTEVDKEKVYKGESVVVSYYFFARNNSFSLAGEKYPEMSGFLKEEVDMTVLTGRLDSQTVILDGVAYRKVLLARYSATPLKAGKLTIDPLYIKAQYYDQTNRRGGGGDDEAEDLFSQFFNRLTPQVAQLKSDVLMLEVEDTPKAPGDFIGAVGEFSIVAVLDKTEVRVNEPFTLALKLEGKGNFSSIKPPPLDLPKGLQLFETKNQTHGGKARTQGEKIFEYLIVPRLPGPFTIPGFSFSYLNTKTGKYQGLTSEGFQIKVTGVADAAQPEVDSSPNPAEAVRSSDSKETNSPIGFLSTLKPKSMGLSRGALVSLGLLLVGLLIPLFGIFFRRKKGNMDPEKKQRLELEKLKLEFDRIWAGIRWEILTASQIKDIATAANNYLLDWCAIRFGNEAKSLPRNELRQFLLGTGKISEDAWNQIAVVLDSLEKIQFSGQGVNSSEMKVEAERSIARLRELLT